MNNVLTLEQPLIFRRKSSAKSSKRLFGFKLFLFLEILAAAGLLVLYIFQVNGNVSERYLIQDYQNRIKELSQENQKLEISSSQEISLEKMMLSLENSDFEKTDKINYIQILDGQVVAK